MYKLKIKNSIKLFIIIMLFNLTVPSVWSQDFDIDTSRRTAIVNAIEKAGPAVVTINVVQVRRERVIDPFFQDFWQFFNRSFATPPRVRDRAIESIGSGFLFDAQGHILTNYHVIQDANIISVSLTDGRNVEVELVAFDERTDLAVLRAVGVQGLPYINLGSSEDLMIGEWVITIGNPFGNMMGDHQPSASVGVVSAMHRRVNRRVGGGDRLYQDMIQTDAAINPGNSGGPLVNALGEVVGVNTMIFSRSGGSQGLGFAIPIDRVKRVTQELIEHGRRRNPWLGFHGEALEVLNPYSLRELGVQAQSGVLVTEMLRESPASRSGLELGDVIQEINGVHVTHPTDIDYENWGLFVGDPVVLKIDRQGEQFTIEFQVEELSR